MNAKKKDIKLFLLLILFCSLDILIAAFGVFHRKNAGIEYINIPYFDLFFDLIFLNWLLMVFFSYLIMKTTKYFLSKSYSWLRIGVIHFLFSIVFTALTWVLGIIVLLFLGRISLDRITIDLFFSNTISVLDENFTIYIGMVAIVYTYYYIKRTKDVEVKSVKLETQLTDSRMKILTSQLQPHFLFNTLHSIHSLMDVNIKKSKDMLLNLSDLLRGLVENQDEHLVSLKDELAFVDKYVNIIKERFTEDLIIKLETDHDLEQVLIPNMLLQPIIENSIKHGYSKSHASLSIQVKIYLNNSEIVIQVRNNGEPLSMLFEEVKEKGIGIKNTVVRLSTLYKEDYSINMFNEDGWVVTQIKIPLQFASENSHSIAV